MKLEKFECDKAPYGDFQVRKGEVLFNRVGPMNAQVQKKNKKAPEGRGVWAFPWPIFDPFFVSASFSSPTRLAPKNEYTEDGELVYVDMDKEDRIVLKKSLQGLKRYVSVMESKMPDEKLIKEKKVIIPFDLEWAISERKDDIKYIEEGLVSGKIPRAVVWKYVHRRKVPELKKRTFWWGGPVYALFCPKGEKIEERWYRYNCALDYVKDLRKYLIDHQDATNFGGKEGEYITYHVRGIKSSKGSANLSADHLEVFIPYR